MRRNSDDQNAAAAPVPTSPTDPTNIAVGTRYLDPFTQFLIASLARSSATTQEPLVSPELSNALAWGVPIFPKDILGFDPNRIPASQWPTTPPIFLHDRLGSSPVRPPPSPWRFSSASAQGDQSSFVPDTGGAATHSLLARIAPKQVVASSTLPAPGTYPGLFPPPPSIATGGGVLPIGPDGSLVANDLDAATRALAAPNLPVSKSSGAPYFPPPVQSTISGAQWREIGTGAASLIAPNLTGYLTNTSPPSVYPMAPGKIPSVAPDPMGAIIDIAALAAAPEERVGIGVAGKAATVLGESIDAAAAKAAAKGIEDAALGRSGAAAAPTEGVGGAAARDVSTAELPQQAQSAAAEPILSAAEQLRSRRAAQMKVNNAAGVRFENETNAEFDSQELDVGTQVTVKTPTGSRTRVDFVTRNHETSEIDCIECKGSETARVRRNQREAHTDIEQYGATVVGKGKPGFPGGMKIPPTSVQILRPRK